jgi:hypothetical protein
MREIIVWTSVLLVASSAVQAQEATLFTSLAPLSALEWDADAGFALGAGLDVLTGQVRGDCVRRTDEENAMSGQAVETKFRLEMVENASELRDKLEVSTSGRLAVSGVRISGRAAFASENSINAYSLYLLTSVFVTNQTKRMRDVTLKKEIWDDLATGDAKAWERFREQCGDQFIIGYSSGAEYHAILELKTQSEEEKQKIAVELRASGALNTWEASADFSRVLSRASRMAQVNTRQFYRGDPTELSPKPERIMEIATELPTTVRSGNAWPYRAAMMDYKSLRLPPKVNPISIRRQQAVLADLVQKEGIARSTLASIQYIATHSDEFDWQRSDIKQLKEIQSQTEAALDKIYKNAIACYDNQSTCSFDNDIILSVPALPRRKVESPSPGACIADGGRFLTLGGGCRDLDMGRVWSARAAGDHSHSSAIQYCSNLLDGGYRWILPSSTDLQRISGQNGGIGVLRGNLNSWFWSSDSKRVSLRLGTISDQDPEFNLGVLCVRVGSN